MTLVKRKYSFNVSYNMKVVEGEEGSYVGFTQITANARFPEHATRTRLVGLCLPVSVSGDRSKVSFDTDDMFFYGNLGSLRGNYRTGQIPGELDTQKFVRLPYSPQTTYGYHLPHLFGTGYMQIPLPELKLGTAQQQMLPPIEENARVFLCPLAQQLQRVEVDMDDTSSMASFDTAMHLFPPELIDAALQQRAYHKARSRYTKGNTVELSFPEPQEWRTPFGALPPWARDYWRKHRK